MRYGYGLCFYLVAICFLLSPIHVSAKTKVNLVPVHVEPCDYADCVKNFQEYKTLSRYGHSDAMYTLAEMYRLGYGTEVDLRLATKWYRRSAKLNNPYAEYKAAIIYLQEGDNQDIDKAMRYLRNANRADLNEATHLLGMLYIEGELIPQDIEKAKEYLTKSYDAEHFDTLQLLSELSNIQLDIDIVSTSAITKDKGHSQVAIVAPKGEMEVIEVNAPSLEEAFTYHIDLLRGNVADGTAGTGTLLRGKACADIFSCSSETDDDRIRDFLMSTW